MTLAAVNLWGRRIGAVSLDPERQHAVFQYTPEFVPSGIQVAPLVMPLAREPYTFPDLPLGTFRGLPGLLADSLPDRWGNLLIDAWLAQQGRTPDGFDAVERLCYTGVRGMGALEYEPSIGPPSQPSKPIEIEALVELASAVLSQRDQLHASFANDANCKDALRDILRVGTSAGGARAKAVIAWNPSTQEVRSGQLPADSGFEHWLLKFDGVTGNRDRELEDPRGYCAVEFAYNLMAKAAGIITSPSRLLEENGRRHFMTKRFDRLDGGSKLHMQSLGALAHFDFNVAGAYSYEQAMLVMRRLGLPASTVEEQFRRMAFNILARNQDDHVKNIAFLMNKQGVWSLAPAFDLTYAYNPDGPWTSRHQMSMNGKRDDFLRDDFRACAKAVSLKRGRSDAILDEVLDAVSAWPAFAKDAGVRKSWREQVAARHRIASLARR